MPYPTVVTVTTAHQSASGGVFDVSTDKLPLIWGQSEHDEVVGREDNPERSFPIRLKLHNAIISDFLLSFDFSGN